MNNNNLNNKIIKIGIDARFYGPIGKGLGRYVQEITDKVINIDENSQYQFVIFLSKDNYDEFSLNQFKHKKIKKVLADVGWYGFKEQLIFPYLIWREKLDLIHFPHFNVPILNFTPFVLTIHDLILTKFPSKKASTLNNLKYYFKHLMYQIVIKLALRRAKKVIAVSNFTKEDLIKRLKAREDKIIVTYEGVANLAKGRDNLFVVKLDNQETLFSYNISSPYLLYVGNAYPHKNLEFLLTVFPELEKRKKNLKLVLVGKEDYFYRRIKREASRLNLWQENNKNNLVIFTDYVPDPQLKILYNQAFIYIFPSLYEGFGLPPLEAMANSCPVLSSDQASLPEILGSAAIYFDPKNKESLIDSFNQLIINKSLREDLINKGKSWVKKYNWWECASLTFNIYTEVLRNNNKL